VSQCRIGLEDHAHDPSGKDGDTVENPLPANVGSAYPYKSDYCGRIVERIVYLDATMARQPQPVLTCQTSPWLPFSQ
jgi:hypothetical protein